MDLVTIQRALNDARLLDNDAYARAEPEIVRQLLELRTRLVRYNLGTPIHTPSWPSGMFVPPSPD